MVRLEVGWFWMRWGFFGVKWSGCCGRVLGGEFGGCGGGECVKW